MVLLLVILCSTLIISIRAQNTPQQLQEPPAQQITSANNSFKNNNGPTLPHLETRTYSSATYHVAFPQNWIEDTNADATFHGNMLSLQPDVSNPNENAHVVVEINSTRDISLASMSAGLSLLGFHKSYTTVEGITAQKFTGIVTLSQKTLHNIIYLLTYNNQIYLIKLSYQGSEDDSQLEAEYTEFVNSFTFN